MQKMKFFLAAKTQIAGYSTLGAILATGIWVTSVAENRHTVASPDLGKSQFSRDPKLGELAPRWLREKVSCPCVFVALSCTECLSPAFFDHLKEDKRENVYVMLPLAPKDIPKWVTGVWPMDKIVSYPQGAPGLNLWFTPRTYRLDRSGRISFIQRDYGTDPTGDK